MSKIEIKSITPQYEEHAYVFLVEIEADGKPHSFLVNAGRLLDFDQFRVTVASRTGHLLEIQGEWDGILANAWRPQKPPPSQSPASSAKTG